MNVEKDKDASGTLVLASDKKYLWDGVEIAEERSPDGGTVAKRFYSQGFVDNDGTTLFYTRDHLGSIRELTDATQTVRARYEYDPYGRMTKISGDRDSAFGFTGHFWHGQSGLFLTLYRAYDPNLGRWISTDPLWEKGGVNLYRYALNSPVDYYDLLGDLPEGAKDKAWSWGWFSYNAKNFLKDLFSPIGFIDSINDIADMEKTKPVLPDQDTCTDEQMDEYSRKKKEWEQKLIRKVPGVNYFSPSTTITLPH